MNEERNELNTPSGSKPHRCERGADGNKSEWALTGWLALRKIDYCQTLEEAKQIAIEALNKV